MKYKVIGWTWYENYSIPFSNDNIGFAERNAIIDDIKKHKYLFTGWDHQESWNNCVPVLNDGKKRGFSQRGWGGVMAEAYEEMDDYSYARYTFHQSVDEKYKKYPHKEFNEYKFVPKPLKNEHFKVEVCEELFEIASKKNPFYLEDLEALRYIDKNDTITLNCKGKSLTFLVADIDRNKKELKFPKHHLINGKYKIIITHKPMAKVYTRTPLLILQEDAKNLFKECAKEYDFNTLLELFTSYDVDFVVNNSVSKKTISILKKFVNEYIEYVINTSIVTKVLCYINDYDFAKEVAYKIIDREPLVFVNIINYFYKKGQKNEQDIKTLVKVYKGDDIYIRDLLLEAIELNPENKSLRKRYYKISKLGNHLGFILYMGIGETKSMIASHKSLLELDDFNLKSEDDIHCIAELMSYPDYDVRFDDKYCYYAPSFFDSPYKCINEGVLKYQEYVNEKYNLSNRMEELLLIGINKACSNVEEYLDGENNAAKYVYALDALTGFRFELKKKAIERFPHLKKYIMERYKNR